MTAQNKELARVKRNSDLALKISIITAISFTVVYVYEMLVFISGNNVMPSLMNYFMST